MTVMVKLLDAKHVKRRKRVNMRAILVNKENNGEFYWEDISEDEENFFLEGYVVEREGKTYDCVYLSKEKWSVKQEIADSDNDWRKGESKKERKARKKAEREAEKRAEENEKENESSCDIRSREKQSDKELLEMKYGETDAG
jgi:hypothetical protein